MIGNKLCLCGGLALLLLAPASERRAAGESPGDLKVPEIKTRLSGPYVHENLTVFLLHGQDQDRNDYLTLDQGLDKKLVLVSEKKNERVNELVIENKSDRPLFLQEGDRLQGGKQDRIIVTSLIVPARSGTMPVPTFCVEQSRWQAGAGGNAFRNTSNAILAPQSVRAAAKTIAGRGGQGAVWREVARQKAATKMRLGSANTNSSLNETLDSPQVKKICDACAKALNDLAGKNKDAIGVAIALNGKVEEVNIYPNHELFVRLYPRLLQSYAVQAALDKDKGKKPAAVAAVDVEKFMAGGKEKAKRSETINADNRLRVRDLENQVECVTAYKGQAVHRQWLNRASIPPSPPQRLPRQQNDNSRQSPPRQQSNRR